MIKLTDKLTGKSTPRSPERAAAKRAPKELSDLLIGRGRARSDDLAPAPHDDAYAATRPTAARVLHGEVERLVNRLGDADKRLDAASKQLHTLERQLSGSGRAAALSQAQLEELTAAHAGLVARHAAQGEELHTARGEIDRAAAYVQKTAGRVTVALSDGTAAYPAALFAAAPGSVLPGLLAGGAPDGEEHPTICASKKDFSYIMAFLARGAVPPTKHVERIASLAEELGITKMANVLRSTPTVTEDGPKVTIEFSVPNYRQKSIKGQAPLPKLQVPTKQHGMLVVTNSGPGGS